MPQIIDVLVAVDVPLAWARRAAHRSDRAASVRLSCVSPACSTFRAAHKARPNAAWPPYSPRSWSSSASLTLQSSPSGIEGDDNATGPVQLGGGPRAHHRRCIYSSDDGGPARAWQKVGAGQDRRLDPAVSRRSRPGAAEPGSGSARLDLDAIGHGGARATRLADDPGSTPARPARPHRAVAGRSSRARGRRPPPDARPSLCDRAIGDRHHEIEALPPVVQRPPTAAAGVRPGKPPRRAGRLPAAPARPRRARSREVGLPQKAGETFGELMVLDVGRGGRRTKKAPARTGTITRADFTDHRRHAAGKSGPLPRRRRGRTRADRGRALSTPPLMARIMLEGGNLGAHRRAAASGSSPSGLGRCRLRTAAAGPSRI